MTDPAERFIEAAVRPLAENPELYVAARQEVAKMVAGARVPADSLDTAAARFEAVDLKSPRAWRRYTLYAATAILSVAVLATSWTSVTLLHEAYAVISAMAGKPVSSFGRADDSWEKRFSKGLTPAQKLLLMGDTRRKGKAARFAALWESDPENPAYYADYATAYLSQHSKLPPDFMETARKLDSDNGWFAAIAAGVAASNSFDTGSRATTSPSGAKIKSIKDPAKLDEALDLLHEAAKATRIDSHQLAMIKQRVPLLPPRTDNLDQLVPTTYMAGLTAPNMRIRYLADAVSAKAIQLAGNRDSQGFKRLLADWEAFTAIYLQSEDASLVDTLLVVVAVRAPLKALSEAAGDLGMPEDSLRLKALDHRFETWKNAQKSRTDPNGDLTLHSSTLAGLALPAVSRQSMNSPILTDEDLKPGRLADHALAGRLMSLIGWSILGLAALTAWLYRYRCGILPRQLSARLTGLLRPVDWLWLIGVGIILPLLFYGVISRLTPLGGREWSLKASLFTVPSGQFSSMLWLMVVLPLVIARWRLAQRGGALGLAGRKQIFGWMAVACGFLALPVLGLTFETAMPSKQISNIAGILLGILQLYALIVGIRALFSKSPSLLRRSTVSRILMPAYVTGMAVMMVALLCFHADEKHWIAKDKLMEITAEAPSMNRFEYEVSQALKKELLEIVGKAP